MAINLIHEFIRDYQMVVKDYSSAIFDVQTKFGFFHFELILASLFYFQINIYLSLRFLVTVNNITEWRRFTVREHLVADRFPLDG